MATARKWFGFISPASGVTMPCRSASASLPVRMSKSSLVRQHGGHGGRARRIHPDLAVPVERHEAPGRVDVRVHDGEVELVAVADRAPVVHADAPPSGSAPMRMPLALIAVDVDDVLEVVDVVARGSRRSRRRSARLIFTSRMPSAMSSLARFGDPAGRVGVGRAAVRRVVLEAAVASAGCGSA